MLTRDRHHGVEILRARGTRFSKRRFAGRATNYVTYFLSACYAGLRLDKPDVVVALTDPPIVGLAAWLAGLRFRAPLVMAFQDVFPEVTVLMEDFHSDTINGALQAVNTFLVRRAARSIAIGDTMRRRLIENKGASPDRTVVISNWADTSAIQPGPRHNAFSAAHDLDDKFVVMHSGNLGLSQSLETLVDAAALLRDVPDVRLVFQGDGVKKPALEQRATGLGLDERPLPAVHAQGAARRVVRGRRRLHRLAAARPGRLHRAEQALRHSRLGAAVHRGGGGGVRGRVDRDRRTTAASSSSRAIRRRSPTRSARAAPIARASRSAARTPGRSAPRSTARDRSRAIWRSSAR